jgi:hypothetical protein
MMEASDWRHLPYPGSLLEQPEWIIEDLWTWRYLAGIIERQNAEKKAKIDD